MALLCLAVSPSLIALNLTARQKNDSSATRASTPGSNYDGTRESSIHGSSISLSSTNNDTWVGTVGHNGMNCKNESNGPCCAQWTFDTDEWWTWHPQYRIGLQNKTHTCFEKIQDVEHIEFLEKVQNLQWLRNDEDSCLRGVQKPQISSGYAAALMSISRSFYSAYRQGKSFQMTRHHAAARWNFAVQNQSHWAYCESLDMNCFFIPIGKCPAAIGRSDADIGAKPTHERQKKEFLWLRQYAFRPRHVLRHNLEEYLDEALVGTSEIEPCSAIHVRRGDIAYGKGRRYAAVDEYLQVGNISKGETVVLLTDDVSAVNEVEEFLKDDYNWVFLRRPRNRGPEGGFEGFIPSQDPSFEVLAIMAEAQLAGRCHKLVHGKSGFVAVIEDQLIASGNAYERIHLPVQLDKRTQPKLKPGERAEKYMKAIREHYRTVNKKMIAFP